MKLEHFNIQQAPKMWKTLDARRDKWSNMWIRRLTVYQNSIRGGTKRLGGFSEQLFLPRAQRARPSEAKVCIVRGSFVLGRFHSQGVSRGRTSPNPPHKWQFSAVASPQTAQCEKTFTFPSVFSVVQLVQSMIVLKRTAGTSQPMDYVTYTCIRADHGVDIAWILQASIATVSVIWHPHHHLNKPYLLCLVRSNKGVLTVYEDRRFWSFRNLISFYTIRLHPG